jgi:AcrR family transcriptional regulator
MGSAERATKVEAPPFGAKKRAAIMAAGLDLFAERGFHGTTVPALAAKARVGAGTFYRYFESKEALVNQLYQYWKTEYGHHLLDGIDFAATPRALFHQIWTRLRAFAAANPKVVDFLELHHHGSYLDEESRKVERGVLTKIRFFIEEAQKNQVLRRTSSPEVLGAVVWGAFNGLFRAGTDGYVKLDEKAFEEAEEAVWSAIRV